MKLAYFAYLLQAVILGTSAYPNLLSYISPGIRPVIAAQHPNLDHQDDIPAKEIKGSVLNSRQLSGPMINLCQLIANFSSPASCILIGAYFVRDSFNVGDVYNGTCEDDVPQYLGTLGNWFGFRQNFTWNRTSTDQWNFSLSNYTAEWTSSVNHNGTQESLAYWVESTNLDNSTQYIATNFTC